MSKIILNPGAPAEREIDIARMDTVPDLWHVAERAPKFDSELILKTWHTAHDLMNFIRALDSAGGLQVTIERAIDRIAEYLTDSEECGLEEDTGREQCEAWAEALQGYAGMLCYFPADDWTEGTAAEIALLTMIKN